MLENQKYKLARCSFADWYANFKKISIKSHTIPIPPAVLAYLKDEMIILPKECDTGRADTQLSDTFQDEDTEEAEPPEFPDFSRMLKDKLTQLGGEAFIKTNWHSPKDSVWITAGQTMKANCLADIYMLLKASSICKEDLAEEEVPQVVVLRQWTDIHPGTEFRCFVKGHRLVAISPRDWPQYHEHIATNRKDIVNDIVSIFKEKIKGKFPLSDYVFDVVRETKDEVYLLDFSPFDEKCTQSYAFEWRELLEDFGSGRQQIDEEEDDPEFRYLPESVGIQPNPRNNYGIPQDVIDLFKRTTVEGESSSSTTTTTQDDLLNRLREECERQED